MKLFNSLATKKEQRINDRIDVAVELEKDGFHNAALHLIKKLVEENPSCQACRIHMGRIAAQKIEDNTPTNSISNQ